MAGDDELLHIVATDMEPCRIPEVINKYHHMRAKITAAFE